ncbi:NADPH oxidase 4 [Labeo rohita]|uniref:NADPH oxidase 4 n=1 Tax=Labeo rohita TaxID=84645 RepID=A0A498MRK6_LABRO|nr:NADPH oxidase 4 [Labeo rohita]
MGVALKSWRANEGPKHLILMVWIAINVYLFWSTFMLYFSGSQYYYLHKMLGLGLCISRASASVLNFNCSLVLLPMCRSLLTFLRGSQRDPRILIISTVAGVTGVLLVLVLFLMFTASSSCIRVSSYEIFWYTHNLFIVFYVVLMVHAAGGALKYQSNVEAHPPGCVHNNLTSLTNHRVAGEKGAEFPNAPPTVCQEEARFQPHFPQTWLWVSAPLCLYCAERLYRFIRSSTSPVTIVSVVSHPCDVVELRMLKSGFKPRPGQYILLNCPSVSSFENHPFTLTTCPTEKNETFGIHLRVLGDWTLRFSQLLLQQSNSSEILPVMQQRRYPTVHVDGPFGSPSEEVLNYELWRDNRPDYLNVQLYLSNTQGLQSISEERYRFLSSRLRIGRPKWKLLFQEIGRANQLKRVGVFCCGPKGISKALHTLCNSNPHSGTAFEYNKESFS